MNTLGSVFVQNKRRYVLTYVGSFTESIPKCYAQISTCCEIGPDVSPGVWKEQIGGDTNCFFYCTVSANPNALPNLWYPSTRAYREFIDKNRGERDALNQLETHFNLIVSEDKTSARMIDLAVHARDVKKNVYHQLMYPTGVKNKGKVEAFVRNRSAVQEGILEISTPDGQKRNYRDVEIQWKTWVSTVMLNYDLAAISPDDEPISSGCMASDSRVFIMDADEDAPLVAIQSSKTHPVLSVLFPKPRREELPLIVVKWNPQTGKSWVHTVITPEHFENNSNLIDSGDRKAIAEVLFGALAGTYRQLASWEEKVISRHWVKPFEGAVSKSRLADSPMDLREYFKVKREILPPCSFQQFQDLIDHRLKLYTVCLTKRFDRRLVSNKEEHDALLLKTKEDREKDRRSFLAMAAVMHFQTEEKSRIRYKWQNIESRLLNHRLALTHRKWNIGLAEAVLNPEKKTATDACEIMMVNAVLDRYSELTSDERMLITSQKLGVALPWCRAKTKTPFSTRYPAFGVPVDAAEWVKKRNPNTHPFDHRYNTERLMIAYGDIVVVNGYFLPAFLPDTFKARLSKLELEGSAPASQFLRRGLSRFLQWGRELLVVYDDEKAVPVFDLAEVGSVMDLVKASRLPNSHQFPTMSLMPPCMQEIASRAASGLSEKEKKALAAFHLSLQRDSGDLDEIESILGPEDTEALLEHHRSKSVFGSYTDFSNELPWSCNGMEECKLCPVANQEPDSKGDEMDLEDYLRGSLSRPLFRFQCFKNEFRKQAKEHLKIELETETVEGVDNPFKARTVEHKDEIGGEEVFVSGAGKMLLFEKKWYIPSEIKQPSDFSLGLLLLKFQRDHPDYKFATNPKAQPGWTTRSSIASPVASPSSMTASLEEDRHQQPIREELLGKRCRGF